MTDGVLNLIEKYIDIDIEKYKEIQRSIRKEIRRATKAWALGKYLEIEDLEKKHDSFSMYRKVKVVHIKHLWLIISSRTTKLPIIDDETVP